MPLYRHEPYEAWFNRRFGRKLEPAEFQGGGQPNPCDTYFPPVMRHSHSLPITRLLNLEYLGLCSVLPKHRYDPY